MKVAIFADIHGKVLLPFTMVDRYQQETGERVAMRLNCLIRQKNRSTKLRLLYRCLSKGR